MKYVLFALASMLWLSGCYPAFRTVQPRVQLLVVDSSGRPVEGATFTLVTYRHPFVMPATTKFARYETDSAGAISIRRRGDWRMEALLPDGSSWHAWRYCVEKQGYRAIASEETRKFKRPLTIVLERYPGTSQCRWPEADDPYYDVEVVE